MSAPEQILVIEDEKQIREAVTMALECEGFATRQAGSARHALVEAAQRQPDLLILDLGLPDRDGVDFIRDYRAWSWRRWDRRRCRPCSGRSAARAVRRPAAAGR